MLRSIFWCSLTLLCGWLKGFVRVCVGKLSHVWSVMFPFLSVISAGFWKQRRDVVSSMESAVSKSCLYSRPTDYIEGESPHLPKDLDHSLGIAREEVGHKCLTPRHAFDPSFAFVFSFLTLFPWSSGCVQGKRSAGVEEEVWGQPAGGDGDEVSGIWVDITSQQESRAKISHRAVSFLKGKFVTKRPAFRLRLLSLFIIASGFLTPIASGNCYCWGLWWSNANLEA